MSVSFDEANSLRSWFG